MNRIKRLIKNRSVITGIMLIIQLLILSVVIFQFEDQFVYFYTISKCISVVVMLHIINNDSNPAYKIAWLIPIGLLSIFGSLLYIIFGKKPLSKRKRRKMRSMGFYYKMSADSGAAVLKKLEGENEDAALQSGYLNHAADSPPYQGTETRFFPLGEEQFAAMMEDMEQAKRFIFLEYFIITPGVMWNSMLELLERKAKEGVDVRLIYDDFGCTFNLPGKYDQQLEARGIQTCIFNRFRPVLSPRFNNRDHRKICIVDGMIGYTGGLNLADEYINAIERFGHWKDCGVRLKGEAVWGLTTMFLYTWSEMRNGKEDFTLYRPPTLLEPVENDGYVQPFMDSPLDSEAVSETVYLNLINRAKQSVYISTPYLNPDSELMTALMTAAKCGVDVRIVVPHIPDKKFVHALTKSYYPVLVEAGVRIYEYTPGFIHAKTVVVDQKYGLVGTINLDYRSLFLHYECGVWMYQSQAVGQLYEDYCAMLPKCEEITIEECRSRPFYTRIRHSVLRVFAPLI